MNVEYRMSKEKDKKPAFHPFVQPGRLNPEPLNPLADT
jgi:hypothetical protein